MRERIREMLKEKRDDKDPSSRCTVIVVDDEPENCASLVRALRGHYEVLAFTSASSALAATRDQRFTFDIVVSDQRMPDMTGVQMLEVLKKTHPKSIRILLTGYSDPQDIIDAVNRAEVFRYVCKPWKDTELLGVLNDAKTRLRKVQEQEVRFERLRRTNEHLREALGTKDETADDT